MGRASTPAATVADAIAAVARRLTLRRAAVGGLLGATALAWPVAAATHGLPAVGGLVAAAAAGATVAAVVRRDDPAAWLDRAGARDELVQSAAAVIDGRVGASALAPHVLAAAAIATRARRPRWLVTIAVTLTAVAVIAGVAARPRRPHAVATGDDRGALAARVDATGVPPSGSVAAVAAPAGDATADRADDRAAAGRVGELARPSTATAAVAPAALGSRSLEPSSGAATSSALPRVATGGGAGAGDASGGMTELAVRGGAAVAAAPGAAELAIDARVAGADPAVLAVAPRYRAVVRAYLEAR